MFEADIPISTCMHWTIEAATSPDARHFKHPAHARGFGDRRLAAGRFHHFLCNLGRKAHDGLNYIKPRPRLAAQPGAPDLEKSVKGVLRPALRSQMIKRFHRQMKRPAAPIFFPG